MNTNKILLLMLVLVTLLTSSCQTPRTSRVSETQLQLARYSLKKADLPQGWKFEGESWSVDFGGESYTVTYEMDMLIFVSHVVSIHPSEEEAKQAYQSWEGDWFDTTYLQPDEPYSPLDEDDDYRYECEKIKPDSPIKVCFYLQRHNDVINFVHISFDGRNKDNPTFAEINDILSILDERLNEVVIDAKPEGNTP